jgi:hypothetical protein
MVGRVRKDLWPLTVKKRLSQKKNLQLWQIKDFNFTDAENQAKDRFKKKTNEIKSV